jgi:hypothetical protein
VANKILRHAILPEQGIGFYEVPAADMPFPESQSGTAVVFDFQDYLHGLVLDASTGKWYDMTTRQGPAGTNITKIWTGKSELDFNRYAKFREDRGSQEHEKITHLESHVYLRPTDEINKIDVEGYDDTGYPEGLQATLNLYVDGEPVTPNGRMLNIPITGDIKCDKKIEGSRIQIELITNRGDHYITDRQQYYAQRNKAAAPANRVSTELGYQAILADVLFWVDYFNGTLINRCTGSPCAATGIAAVSDPIGSTRALRFTGTKILGTVSLTDGNKISVWATDLPEVTIGTSEIIMLEFDGPFDGWYLYAGDAASVSGNVSVECSGDLFDLRIYSTSVTDDTITYYYDDIAMNNGGIVVP